ncbi:MAG TPA: hypothetical protein VK558_10200 [Patescibacteria group bacterium]|nr:hypothetical protein [Patescibacteria group bacterium]
MTQDNGRDAAIADGNVLASLMGDEILPDEDGDAKADQADGCPGEG